LTEFSAINYAVLIDNTFAVQAITVALENPCFDAGLAIKFGTVGAEMG